MIAKLYASINRYHDPTGARYRTRSCSAASDECPISSARMIHDDSLQDGGMTGKERNSHEVRPLFLPVLHFPPVSLESAI